MGQLQQAVPLGPGVPNLHQPAALARRHGVRGAVWVLFLDTDGTVKSHQKISDTEGGFTGVLDYDDSFGTSVAVEVPERRDGVGDLAVGAPGDGDGGKDE